MKISRNAPCPCGSGKKYKLCCLPERQAKRQVESAPDRISLRKSEDDLDALSNHVIDLIHASQFDEAEAAARDLMQRFPEAIDGLERLGHVYEARGDSQRAAHYYRQAVAHVGGADADEHTRWLHDLAEQLDPDAVPD